MIDIVMGAQWGSEGKGKLSGYLAKRGKYAAVINNFSPNAGHTWVDDQGNKFVVCMLPVAAVTNPSMPIFICAGAALNQNKLMEEIEKYHVDPGRILIDPHASLVEQIHLDEEAGSALGARISSTVKGAGAAQGFKAMRKPNHRVAKDAAAGDPIFALKMVSKHPVAEIIRHDFLNRGDEVLYETAQGFDLSLNHGLSYPFITSRDVTPMTVMSELGIHWSAVGHVYAAIRPFPIRVGGPSGPYYSDQRELTWDEMQRISGAKESIQELTTVTKKVRRVFTFSDAQIDKFFAYCHPTHLFVNFINHFDAGLVGVREFGALTRDAVGFISHLDSRIDHSGLGTACHVALIGTGAKDSEMIDLDREVKDAAH